MFQKEQFQNFQFLAKNHGLSPLENFDVLTINKSTFLSSGMPFYQIERSKTLPRG